MTPSRFRRRYKMLVPKFGTAEAIRRAKLAAMQGDLDRAERWMKLEAMMEKAAARDRVRLQAAMKENEEQAFRDRMANRIDQREFR